MTDMENKQHEESEILLGSIEAHLVIIDYMSRQCMGLMQSLARVPGVDTARLNRAAGLLSGAFYCAARSLPGSAIPDDAGDKLADAYVSYISAPPKH